MGVGERSHRCHVVHSSLMGMKLLSVMSKLRMSQWPLHQRSVWMTKCCIRKLTFKHLRACERECKCVCVHIVEWYTCIYSMFPRGDTQWYSAYVLHVIDLPEKTNVIAVDKPKKDLTEWESNTSSSCRQQLNIRSALQRQKKMLLSTSL